ncbi:hypothetical protein Leryth_011136 [Lithospermum erythrorhizon]|nr:hypothetical protein Leryth_011136 [Lithospermum erythrorhizon]
MGISRNLPSHHYADVPPPSPMVAVDGGNTHIDHSTPSLLHMSFYWSKEAKFLFPGWPDNNTGMYALSIIFVFTLAILVEFLSNVNVVKPEATKYARILFQMGINGIRAGFHYMVILSVVSYNGGVFISAILGHAVGYVIFGSPIFKKGKDK